MLEAISAAFSAIKETSPVVFLGIAIATGLSLFASDSLIGTLGLVDFRNQNRAYLGGAFILSSSLLLAQSVAWLGRKAQFKLLRRRHYAQLREALHGLTPDEKAYLLPFVVGGVNTIYLRAQDGVAGGLIAKKVLYQASSLGSMMTGFAHNMQPWAREYLTKHPHLLQGANPEPTGPPGY